MGQLRRVLVDHCVSVIVVVTGVRPASFESFVDEPHKPCSISNSAQSSLSEFATSRLDDGVGASVDAVFVQFDNRDLHDSKTPEFVKVLTAWNKRYADLHGHAYVLFGAQKLGDPGPLKGRLPKDCNGTEFPHGEIIPIRGPGGCLVHPAWGKVKAMVEAEKLFPNANYFIFFDTDAAVNFDNGAMNVSIPKLFQKIDDQHPDKRPMIVTADVYSYFTSIVLLNSPYEKAIISGNILWRGKGAATDVLNAWWKAATDEYTIGEFPSHDAPFGPGTHYNFQFRWQWPWDQDRLNAIVNDPYYKDLGSKIRTHPDPKKTKKERKEKSGTSFWELTLPSRSDCSSFKQVVAYVSHVGCFSTHYTDNKAGAPQEFKSRSSLVEDTESPAPSKAHQDNYQDMLIRISQMKAHLLSDGCSIESVMPSQVLLE